MIRLLKTNIEKLNYENSNSVRELLKLTGISKFVIDDTSRGRIAENNDFNNAIYKLVEAEGKVEDKTDLETFNTLKSEALQSINNLLEYLQSKGYLDEDSFDKIMHGEGYRDRKHHVDFALLMAEQNHVDYFKTKKSRFETQVHERLYEHYMIKTENGQSTFFFLNSSDLPQYIKDDVLEHLQKATKELESL